MSTREDDIATFQAITGADDETAEHVLEAHGWDLNRGVNFYMESSDLDFRTPAPAPLSETRTRTSQVGMSLFANCCTGHCKANAIQLACFFARQG